jgi:hypothetical protein
MPHTAARLGCPRLRLPLLDVLQAPFQKINLQQLLADLALQLRHLVWFQTPPVNPGKGSSRRAAELLVPTM